MQQYLDEQGNPSKPVYLDDNGNPVGLEEPTKEITPPKESKGIIGSAWDYLNKGLISPEFMRAIGNIVVPKSNILPDFQEKIRGIGADLSSGLTSPLNIGMTLATGGASTAAKMGLSGLARGLNTAVKVGSAPLVAEGGYNLLKPDSSIGERLLGGAEAIGGGLGLKYGAGIKPKAKLPVAEIPKTEFDLPLNKQEVIPESLPIQENLPIEKIPEVPNQKTPIDRLVEATQQAKPLNKLQAQIYSIERAKRVGEAETVTTKGLAGHYQRLGKLKGEYTKVSTEPLKLDQIDVDSLVDTINEFPTLMRFQKESATSGLVKIIEGRVPQDSEIKLLESVFGKDSIANIKTNLPKIDIRRSLIQESVNLPRAIQAAYDISFPFRQGLGLIHTKGWWTSWDDMLRSYGSEKSYRGVIDSIVEHPNFKPRKAPNGEFRPSFAEEAGLAVTDLTDLSSREEQIMSTFAEKIPGIRASNRAYTAFANKLRADNFNSLIKDTERIYESTKLIAKTPVELAQVERLNPRTNIPFARDIAGYINNASGRGSLGSLEKYAVALNTGLFAPRFIASRVQMMNPANYISKPAFIRKQYLKSIISMASAWFTMEQLGKLAGGKATSDSNSADFGKVKIGNTRLDPGAGFQQYLVLLSRLRPQSLGGGYTSSTSGKTSEYGEKFGSQTRGEAIIRFVRNKLAPTPGFVSDPFFATKNMPFDIVDRTMKLFTPIILQDLSDLIQEDPTLLPALIPSSVGMGTQIYDERGQGHKLFGKEQPEMKIY